MVYGNPGLIRRSSSFFILSDQCLFPGNQFIASHTSLISGKCIWYFVFDRTIIPVAFEQIQLEKTYRKNIQKKHTGSKTYTVHFISTFCCAKMSPTRETLAEKHEQDIITNFAACGENTFLRMELHEHRNLLLLRNR